MVFVLGQREIATADDKDYAHFFVCQILVALKKGNLSNEALTVPNPQRRTCLPYVCTGSHCLKCIEQSGLLKWITAHQPCIQLELAYEARESAE